MVNTGIGVGVISSNSVGSNTGELGFEGPYEDIKNLKNEGSLIPGLRYIITDYQTEYFIEGSNSSGIVKAKEVSSNISGWGVLNNDYEYSLKTGDTAEITSLPEGYGGSLSVGDTVTVTSTNSGYYFKFTGGLHNVIGATFNMYLDRFTGIAKDQEIWDAYGNTIMRAGGLINTQVHNGLPYGEQTAEENPAPPIERIVLTAATNSAFEEYGYSDTFEGDIIEFRFDDTDIINDNKQIIGTRKGIVWSRKNETYNIDCVLDWRAFRFRRWLLDQPSRLAYINQNLDKDTTRVGYDGKFLFTSENRSDSNINPFYLAHAPEHKMSSIDDNAKFKTFTVNVESNIHCKDFTVIPLDSDYNPINVTSFKANYVFGSVFMGLGGEFNLGLNVDTHNIERCTFVSNPELKGDNMSFWKCTALDSVSVLGFNSVLNNVNWLSFFASKNIINSNFQNVICGTSKGGNFTGAPAPAPAAKWHLMTYVDTSVIRNTVFGQSMVHLCMDGTYIVNSSIFMHYSPAWGDGLNRERVYIRGSVLSNLCMTLPKNFNQVGFNNLYFGGSNPASSDGLFHYTTGVGKLSKTEIYKNNANDNLYYETMSADNQKEIIVLTQPDNVE